MSQDFVLNDYVCSRLYDQIGDVWIRLDHGGVSVVCSKNNGHWGSMTSQLYSYLSTFRSNNGNIQLKIDYFYGCIGKGTFVMNTLINFYHIYFADEDKSKVIVYGSIRDEPIDSLKQFYGKFGFEVSDENDGNGAFFEASLSKLQVVPPKAGVGEFYYPLYMFSGKESKKLLASEIHKIRLPSNYR